MPTANRWPGSRSIAKSSVSTRLLGGRRIYIAVFIIPLCVFLAIWWGLHELDVTLQAEKEEASASVAIERARLEMETFLRTAASDIRIVARDRALAALAGGDTGRWDEVTEAFATITAEKPAIAQLRLIDPSGREVVRIDRIGSAVVVISGNDLQDKSDRYYFHRTIALPQNAIYLSDLDLNIEHDAIELPWRPMLRLGTALHDRSGAVTGAVVMNLDAADLLDRINPVQTQRDMPVQLVDDQGYLLAGAPDEQLWGFMFGRDARLPSAAPALWAEMNRETTGMIEAAGRRYVMDRVQAADILHAWGSTSAILSETEGWTLLRPLPEPPPLWGGDQWPRLLLGLTACLAASAMCAEAIRGRRQAESDRRRAEEELIQTERMASLGSLVAGITHEINTPIGNALAVATTLCERVNHLSDAVASGRIGRRSLDALLQDLRNGTGMLLNGLQRAAEIIRNFKQVAADQTSDRRRTFDLATFLAELTGTLRPQFKGTGVELESRVVSTASLESYPGPLGQVLANLVANARIHGFPQSEETPASGVEQKVTVHAQDLADGRVEIQVTDSGRGIPPDIIRRIFDPFFTTALGAGGTGLGLSIVYNIVTGLLGGEIHAESHTGSGTTITVILPKVAPAGVDTFSNGEYDVGRKKRTI